MIMKHFKGTLGPRLWILQEPEPECNLSLSASSRTSPKCKILWLNTTFWKKGGKKKNLANFSLIELVCKAKSVKLYPQDVVQPLNNCLLAIPARPSEAHYRGDGLEEEKSQVWGGEGTSDLEKKTDKNQSRGWRILLRRDSHTRFLSTEIYAIFKSPKLNGFWKL